MVASIAPLADFSRQIGGDRVDVALLLPPGASPHTFEPSPKSVLEISKARLFVRIGAGLEFWADRLISANKGITVVTCSDGIQLLRGAGGGDNDHGHVHSDADPHIWLDPVLAVRIVATIANAFSAADPANAAWYKHRAERYTTDLQKLDREIAENVRAFRTRQFVTFHSAWNYFAKRYGLEVAGVIEEAPGKEPSARHIGKILAEVRRLRTKVIFAEPQFNSRVAEAIAKEAGGQVLLLDPEGGQKGRETYIDLMRSNVSMMRKAMQ